MTTVQRRNVALKILCDGIDTISLGLKKKDPRALEAGALWCAVEASNLKKRVWREKVLLTQIDRQARKIALLMIADGVSRLNRGIKRKDKKMIRSANFWTKIGALALAGSSAGGRPR